MEFLKIVVDMFKEILDGKDPLLTLGGCFTPKDFLDFALDPTFEAVRFTKYKFVQGDVRAQYASIFDSRFGGLLSSYINMAAEQRLTDISSLKYSQREENTFTDALSALESRLNIDLVTCYISAPQTTGLVVGHFYTKEAAERFQFNNTELNGSTVEFVLVFLRGGHSEALQALRTSPCGNDTDHANNFRDFQLKKYPDGENEIQYLFAFVEIHDVLK